MTDRPACRYIPWLHLCTDSQGAAVQTELNRVKGKAPYKELKGEGTVSQQADEAWEYAHSRSNSIIQDIFAGQLQSTLECPACHALSHTFDEFMDLSLPLPQKGSRSLRGGSTCTIQVTSFFNLVRFTISIVHLDKHSAVLGVQHAFVRA